jgi:hypothetical protein
MTNPTSPHFDQDAAFSAVDVMCGDNGGRVATSVRDQKALAKCVTCTRTSTGEHLKIAARRARSWEAALEDEQVRGDALEAMRLHTDGA